METRSLRVILYAVFSGCGAQTDCERGNKAAEWYARHESEDVISAIHCRECEKWTADPANSVKYDEFVSLRRRVALLPRLSLPAAQEVCADMVLPHGSLWSSWLVASAKRFKYRVLKHLEAKALDPR